MPRKTSIPLTQTSFLEPDPVIFFDGQFLSQLPVIPLNLPVLAFDVETQTKYDGVGPKKDFGLSYVADVTVISLAWDDHKLSVWLTEVGFGPIFEAIQSCKTLVAHNAVFDMRQVSKYEIHHDHNHIWDTLTMARLLRPELERFERIKGKTKKGYSLLECLDMWSIPYPEYMKAQKAKRGKLHKQSRESVLAYAADDASLTLELYMCQRVLPMIPLDLIEWEIRAVSEYCRMAGTGLGLNLEFAHNKIKELERIRTIRDHAFTFNPASPKERVKFVYETLGIPKPVKIPYSVFYTATGNLSISTDSLLVLIDENPNEHALNALHDWLSCDVMIRTIQGLLDHAALDNQVHSMINIATVTGRRNSSNPNLQNIKLAGSPGDIEGNLCGLFKPLDPDFTYVELDYNNAENRMQGMLAGDSVMIKACNAGDFHANMAEIYFGADFLFNEPHSPQWNFWRDQSKKITFGNAYGMGAEKLSISLGISQGKAQEILSTKKAAFHAITKAQLIAASRIARDGYIKLWTGRKVPVRKDKAYKAWNAVAQGGVGEMLKRSIVLVSEEYRANSMKSYVAHDMHDALILAVHKDEWATAIPMASRIMESIIPAELNNRTTSPCVWVAQPDLKKNAKKWGSGQYHPEQPKAKKEKPVEKAPTMPLKKVFSMEMPEIGFTGYCDIDVIQIGIYLGVASQAIELARNNTYKIYLWKPDGQVNPQDFREVNLNDAATILKIWDDIRVAHLWTVDQLDSALKLDTRKILALPEILEKYELQIIEMVGAISKHGKQ